MERMAIEVDEKWARTVRSPMYWVVSALTGVSVTFCPLFLFLFLFGREGTSMTDWRVLICLAIGYLIPFVHFRLAAPVMKQIRRISKTTA